MVVLDTHIWIWWADGGERLTENQQTALAETGILAISAVTCWEVAQLVELQRVELDRPVGARIDQALRLPRLRLLALSPDVAVGSTRLPGHFHRAPADQIIVATARHHACPSSRLTRTYGPTSTSRRPTENLILP